MRRKEFLAWMKKHWKFLLKQWEKCFRKIFTWKTFIRISEASEKIFSPLGLLRLFVMTCWWIRVDNEFPTLQWKQEIPISDKSHLATFLENKHIESSYLIVSSNRIVVCYHRFETSIFFINNSESFSIVRQHKISAEIVLGARRYLSAINLIGKSENCLRKSNHLMISLLYKS